VPGKEERAGAHRNGGSTVRWRKRHRAVAFVDGEGAPVGGDGGCGVLQHRRGKGVRKMQEIAEIDSSGGVHQGVADGGGARPEFTRESGLPVGGGSGLGAGSGGVARALERRGRRGVETGGRVEQREQGASDSAAARQRGKEKREKVGVWAWGCHAARGCRGAWPRPADGARSDRAGERGS
jgi:hypothetical protein